MIDRSLKGKFISLSKQYGFAKAGFAKITGLEKEAENLQRWLDEKNEADMKWIKKSFDKRTHPGLIDPDFKSVISLAYIYDTPVAHPKSKDIPKISRYAWGKRDYHKVIKKKLKQLCKEFEELSPSSKFKYYIDDGPVMDKAWAVRAGLGWMGKHTNVIDPEFGSFFFIANIFTDIEFHYDKEIADLCKDCMICVNECPTGAIYDEYKLDARKCISYQTIENHADELPGEIRLNGWVFGCDICQDVCPFNNHKHFTDDENFYPREEILSMTYDDYLNLTEEQFNKLFEGTPVKRTKYNGFIRNIQKSKIEN